MAEAVCNKCGKPTSVVSQFLGKKDNRNWFSIGLKCANDHFFHSYFTHDKLEKRRKKFKKIKNENQWKIEQAKIKDYHLREQEKAKELFLDQ